MRSSRTDNAKAKILSLSMAGWEHREIGHQTAPCNVADGSEADAASPRAGGKIRPPGRSA